ncbi:Eco29kI family restriction endonuclease [Micromonospora sp. RHAY321]|uniref:Eco29kI family restriction endonuclease n=1 Tax=Micromonospora sp. RHAY321 TaxID=2944807 RepID=UPI00207CB423|nr:Eco29kI family restriction endonuclease [Micromonospora sp. RHAY321]MCO1593838.1 Eco29kI family restriction endonuclease [Micromonospora sp. RHAY321]
MSLPTPHGDPATHVVKQLAALVDDLESVTPPSRTSARNALRKALTAEVSRLERAVSHLDPVLRPTSLFDPSAPATTGRIVALTTIAQQRHPLVSLQPFYGAGVYALYYKGPFDAYSLLSGTEQPIYVGKADPKDVAAKDAVSQGTSLFDRLNEHKKNIAKATSTLRDEDFDCRFLIVQTGYQRAAEEYLINFFKPIWNNEIRICYGLGKHGDSATTRANKRSPWDTLHPGRQWASGLAEDQKPESQIRSEIEGHLKRVPPHATLEAILADFLSDLGQLAAGSFTTAENDKASVEADAVVADAPDDGVAAGGLF